MKGIKNSLKKLSFSRQSSRVQTEKDRLLDVNLKRVAYEESFPKILTYKSIPLPGDIIHPKVLDDLQDFDVREDDIYIVSYPQSGSQVVEEIVTNIVNKVNAKNQLRRQREAQVAKLEVANPYGHIRWLKGLKSPRILTTNLPFELIPDKVKETLCRVIYLVRNPKDNAVAYYYHHRVKGILSSFNDFVELYMNGQLLYGDWFNHVSSYWQLSQTYSDNVLFISYEETKIETYSMTKLIIDFLGYDFTENELNEVIESLPKRESENNNKDLTKKSKFEGVIGDWMNYFSPEQSRQMDELFKTRFEKLGLSMAFDPTEALKRIQKYGRIISISNTAKHKRKTSVLNEKQELTKDEVLLLRQKSLNSIEMFELETDEKQINEEIGCLTKMYRSLCPCCHTGYENV